MKSLKRILLALISLTIFAGLGTWWWASSWLNTELTKESLVQKIENATNCRAQIDDFQWSLASPPAKLRLTKLQLATRDSDSEMAKPLSQRAKLLPEAVQIMADSALLEIDWSDLLMHRRLHVGKLSIEGLFVRQEISKEGENSLATLFTKPQVTAVVVENTDATPPTTAEAPTKHTDKKASQKTPSASPDATEKTSAADAARVGIAFVIDEAVLDRASFHIVNREAKTRTDINDLHLGLTQIDIDPTDLAHHNSCDVALSAKVIVEGRAKIGDEIKPVRMADLSFTSTGKLQPFDAELGELIPLTTLELALPKGAILGGHMTIGDTASKDKKFREMKDKFGFDISDIRIGGELQESMVVKLQSKAGRLDVLTDALFKFPEYTLAMKGGSWLDSGSDEQEMNLALTLSAPVAERIFTGAQQKVGDLSKLASQVFDDGEGHTVIELIGSGKLSKPEFKLGGKAGAIQNALQGLGGGLLQGLLNK
jgi:hypothetical protein